MRLLLTILWIFKRKTRLIKFFRLLVVTRLMLIKGEIIHWIEVKLNHKLIRLVCAFLTYDLPLRPLIKDLDGKTLYKIQWSGKIENMLNAATELEINPSFVRIYIPEPLIPLSDTVVKDQSPRSYLWLQDNSDRKDSCTSN